MGKTKVNGKEVVATDDKVPAKDLKEQAGIPSNHRLYDEEGNVYEDEDLVDTTEAEYGVVTPWTRG